jgi:hypothetical protein
MYHSISEYCRLPMGLSVSPDIFQEKMSELMPRLDFACAYLDGLLIISTEKGFDKHLEKLEKVLTPVRSRSKNQCCKKLLWKDKRRISWL